MVNTSATGGYIQPTSASPEYDQAFDDFLTAIVAGIVNLPNTLVRPRWQSTFPKIPEPDVNWCAVGVMNAKPHSSRAQIIHDPNGTIVAPGDGSDVAFLWERDEVLASFYGPNAWGNAGLFDTGLRIPQNRYAFDAAGVGFVNTSTRRQAAEMFPQKRWVNRVDMEITFDRLIQRVYPIYNLLSANGVLHALPPGKSTPTDTTFDTEDGWLG
jgi:hypothetical protein